MMGRTEPYSHQVKKTERVFGLTKPRLVVLPVPLAQLEQVHCAKLLGFYLSDTLQFEIHLVNLLKICSQRTYLFNSLHDQSMPMPHTRLKVKSLNTVLGP